MIFTGTQILQLFSTPIYIGIMTTLDEELKNKIKQVEYEKMQSGNGYISVDKQLLNQVEYQQLKEEVDYHIETFSRETLRVSNEVNFNMSTSWALKQSQDGWAHSHIHSNSVISGVFYLNQHENFGNLVFERTHDNIFTSTLDPNFTDFNPINSRSWAIQPIANMIILFPSILKHKVEKTQCMEERCSVSFNYFMKGTFGYKESILKL